MKITKQDRFTGAVMILISPILIPLYFLGAIYYTFARAFCLLTMKTLPRHLRGKFNNLKNYH